MAFMTFSRIVFKNKKKTFLVPICVPFIVYLLPSLVNYRPYMTLLVSWQGAKSKVFLKNS